jgi:hypothetical protein
VSIRDHELISERLNDRGILEARTRLTRNTGKNGFNGTKIFSQKFSQEETKINAKFFTKRTTLLFALAQTSESQNLLYKSFFRL